MIESISIMDGLALTIVSMLTVFAILTALWGVTELVAKLIPAEEATPSPAKAAPAASPAPASQAANPKHQLAAELIALALASEDKPNSKFEIQDSQRIQ